MVVSSANKENKKRATNHKILMGGLPQIITDSKFHKIVAENEANHMALEHKKKCENGHGSLV